jgi:CheY-like chemotaxis protein
MVTGFSEMILQAPDMYGGKLPPALLADLAVIHRNATHLAELIDDVLDLSQVEADQMSLVKERVCFPDIVEAATEAVRPLFDSKGLYLEAEMPRDMPPVFCDPTRIREVLLNLLSNAGRFTDRGGVHVRVWQEGNDIVTAVADTGPGIAAEDIDRIFRPFHQVDGSTRRRYGGTGLGLAISRRFVELHGGEIWVESWEGVGTEFFFRLPLMPPAPMNGSSWRRIQPEWEYLERPQPPTARKPSIRPRYIVLESGGSFGRILTRYLDEVEIVQVETIQEALEELERTPAWALLINTSSIGKTVGDMQQRLPLPAGTPAIICSVPGVHEASAELGASDRLIKPVSQEALLSALDRLDLESGTVLIIDDEPDALHLFGRMLALSGRNYRVLLARDGREALDVLREESPDVLLLDLIMPNMDGFQLLEIRNQDPVLRNIPVVVISARDPMGQPIVSNAMAITRAGGLSVRQVLDTIQFVSRTLSVSGQSDGSTPRGVQIG